MQPKTYIFAGGGSGGHLFPGIAVAEELRRREAAARILFVGSHREVERRILAATPFEHRALPVESLTMLRKSPWRFLQNNWSAWRIAQQLLADEYPAWVIGLGGYISAPTVWAASRRGIPILLLEQNAIPGAATRWLASSATHIALTFADARQYFGKNSPTIVTGNPLRTEVIAASGRRVHHKSDLCTLLILGGSQGAESLNDAITALLPQLREQLAGWRIVHQTGASRAEKVVEAYRQHSLPATVAEFIPDIAAHYASADLVISRSGATTLSELACIGCPAILVPYPFAADQHQRANARAFVDRGAAVMVEQSKESCETVKRLRGPLAELLTDSLRRDSIARAMRELALPDATRTIVDIMLPVEATLTRGGWKPPARKHKELVS